MNNKGKERQERVFLDRHVTRIRFNLLPELVVFLGGIKPGTLANTRFLKECTMQCWHALNAQ